LVPPARELEWWWSLVATAGRMLARLGLGLLLILALAAVWLGIQGISLVATAVAAVPAGLAVVVGWLATRVAQGQLRRTESRQC
jgi:hypothetical protein